MPTTVTYNNTTVQYPKITRWDQEPVYDESSVNVLYVRHHVEVEFVVAGTDSENFQALMWAIQTNLAEPRKALLIDGGAGADHYVNLIVAGTGVANRVPDMEGGPRPGQVAIVMLAGEIAATCRWSVAFVYQHVGTPAGESGFTKTVLSKTFSSQFTFDEEGRQTRTFVGSARIRDIDANTTAIAVNRLRGLIPPCPRGFRRTACNISMTPDGLSVRVETVDREIACDWIHGVAEVLDATYTEGMPMIAPGGADIGFIIRKTLSLRLRGAKTTTKLQLQTLIMSIINSKFTWIDLEYEYGGGDETAEDDVTSARGKDFPASIVWSENLVENELACQVESWLIPENIFQNLGSTTFARDHLTDKFLAPLPSDVSVATRQQFDGGGGHDVVTRTFSGGERFTFLTPTQRVILSELETHAVQSSNPSQAGNDDFGLSPTRVVTVNFDRSAHVPGEQQGDGRLAASAGLARGGYVVDEEHVDIRIDNGRIVMGNTTLGDAGTGTTQTYQHRAPRLIIKQWGRAYRVGKAPTPRARISYADDDVNPGIVEDSVIKPLPTRTLGPTVQQGVHWRYRTCYNLASADIVPNDNEVYRLNMEARQVSTRASRVFAPQVQTQQNRHFKYNPDPQVAGGR